MFFDAGQQLGSVGYVGPGFSSQGFFGGFFGVPASFPIPTAQATPPIVNPPVAPYSTVYAFPPRLQLPFTLQWNATIEQALGKTQSVILSYVGANGRRLLEQSEVQLSGPPLAAPINPNFTQVFFNKNGLTSDYNALQVRYQRRLSRGVQGIASYTWSHSIDYGSQNFTLPYLRGNSDFDVRHNFAAAVSYDLPGAALRGGFARALLDHWGLDDRFSARTGFPVTLQGATVPDPATGTLFFTGLNQVIGQPVYVYGSQCAAIYNDGKGCPGGRAINPAAFAVPSGNNTGTAARNFVRGFGAWQMDFAMRRDFPIYERFRLQFRAEAFNIFNHPSYGQINAKYCSPITGSPNFRRGCTFGQATSTLAKSLGVLSPLYQEGGPRSMQLALKLVF